ncbi:MAG: potassium channel family protein [Arenicella sp.]
MRRPLIALILVYTIATLGLTLIPGIDPEGNPWRMSIFHAFYFVSFMGSTIGFGELPYPFTDPQRYWVLGCIYVSVVAWLYTIGTMLSLIQDASFKQAVIHQQFSRNIAKLKEPFYILCGYGDTGRILTSELTGLGFTVIVLDKDQDSLLDIDLTDFPAPVYSLNGDITVPETLISAGITNRCCRAVIALTSHDHTNLKVAVSTKALNPNLLTVCRAEEAEEIANLRSFNTDVIINPNEIFANRLLAAMQNPPAEAISQWLISQQRHELQVTEEAIVNNVPTSGPWIICGYGKFGRALKETLDTHQIEAIVIEQSCNHEQLPDGTIEGNGTEAKTLEQANIYKAKGLIAGTNDDANNLSILLTARDMNNKLFTIGRLNEQHNQPLYSSAKPEMTLRYSHLMADTILTRLTRPLVTRFLREIPKLSKQRTSELYQSIAALTTGGHLTTWRIPVTEQRAPAVWEALSNQNTVKLQHLLTRPDHQNSANNRQQALCLLVKRANHYELMPDGDIELQLNDELLFCGLKRESNHTEWLSQNIELLENTILGQRHHIPLLRWWNRRQKVT